MPLVNVPAEVAQAVALDDRDAPSGAVADDDDGGGDTPRSSQSHQTSPCWPEEKRQSAVFLS